MYNNQYIRLAIILSCSIWFLMGEDSRVKVTQFDDAAELLAHPLPADLAGKPIVHLRTLALQKDNFSCGYHALFNAIALDNVVQGGYYDFEKKLRAHLSDRDLFFKVCAAIKEQVHENKPLNGKDILDAASKFPAGSRLAPLFLTEQQEIMMPCLAVEFLHPLNMPQSEIQKLLQEKQKAIVREKITQLIESTKNKPYQTAHFICNIGNHWITYSVITNSFAQPKLYIIGAWNEPMNAPMKKYAIELLSYL